MAYHGTCRADLYRSCGEIKALMTAMEATDIQSRIEIHLKEIEGIVRYWRKVLKEQRIAGMEAQS